MSYRNANHSDIYTSKHTQVAGAGPLPEQLPAKPLGLGTRFRQDAPGWPFLREKASQLGPSIFANRLER